MKEKVLTVRQAQRLDRIAIERVGIPSLALMENAGRAVAEEALRMLRGRVRPAVCVAAGTGNNGGDGFVAARHLVNAGAAVTVFLVGDAARMKPDTAAYYGVLKKCGASVRAVNHLTPLVRRGFERADLIIDALFGIGLNRNLGEPYSAVIDSVNRSGVKILAVDVPSGIDGTSGRVYGVCVRARVTVTFSCMKKGLQTPAGKRLAGRVVVADIGIPRMAGAKI